MSDDALNGILKFYESNAGTEYIKAITIDKERLQKYYAESGVLVMELAIKVYAKDLLKLIKKTIISNVII